MRLVSPGSPSAKYEPIGTAAQTQTLLREGASESVGAAWIAQRDTGAARGKALDIEIADTWRRGKALADALPLLHAPEGHRQPDRAALRSRRGRPRAIARLALAVAGAGVRAVAASAALAVAAAIALTISGAGLWCVAILSARRR